MERKVKPWLPGGGVEGSWEQGVLGGVISPGALVLRWAAGPGRPWEHRRLSSLSLVSVSYFGWTAFSEGPGRGIQCRASFLYIPA